jgi:hypothetical protein
MQGDWQQPLNTRLFVLVLLPSSVLKWLLSYNDDCCFRNEYKLFAGIILERTTLFFLMDACQQQFPHPFTKDWSHKDQILSKFLFLRWKVVSASIFYLKLYSTNIVVYKAKQCLHNYRHVPLNAILGARERTLCKLYLSGVFGFLWLKFNLNFEYLFWIPIRRTKHILIIKLIA